MKTPEEKWWAKNFPTAHARRKADEAVDQLDTHHPMSTFIDTWLLAYKNAGGLQRVF